MFVCFQVFSKLNNRLSNNPAFDFDALRSIHHEQKESNKNYIDSDERVDKIPNKKEDQSIPHDGRCFN